MFESHPELDGLETIPDTQDVPSPAMAILGASLAVISVSLITFALFI